MQQIGTTDLSAQMALERAWFEYQPRLFAYLLLKCRDQQLAEDLVQETFVRAMGALGKNPGLTFHYGWFYRIATNLFIDYARKKTRHPHVLLSEKIDAEDARTFDALLLDECSDHNPEQRLLLREQLSQTCESLSPEERLAFLALFAGYSEAGIVRYLQRTGNALSKTALKMRISRTRKRMRMLHQRAKHVC